MTGISSVMARVAELQAKLGVQPAAGAFDRHLGVSGDTLPHAGSRTIPDGAAHGADTEWQVEAAAFRARIDGRSADWRGQLPDSAGRFIADIDRAAAAAGIDPAMLAAVTWAESSFRPDAVSSAGAIGLTQLMPATAAGLGVDPHDPVENLEGGARYLREQFDRFGSIDLMLAAYNAGPGTVSRAGGVPDIPETQTYIERVKDYYQRLGGTS